MIGIANGGGWCQKEDSIACATQHPHDFLSMLKNFLFLEVIHHSLRKGFCVTWQWLESALKVEC